MEIKNVSITECDLWDKNPRAISKKDFERLKKQIKELGEYKPMIAFYDKDKGKYIIIGGNMRLRAYRELGFENVKLSIVKTGKEADIVKYALSDNDNAGFYNVEELE